MIEFGRNENQLHHTFRHVERAGFNPEAVEQAIREQLSQVEAEMLPGLTIGHIVVSDTVLEYSAYKLPDGRIHVGRITVE